MDLFELLVRKVNTGIVLDFKPVTLEEVRRYAETPIPPGINPETTFGFEKAVQAAFYSNLFSGRYQVYYKKADKGNRPLLEQPQVYQNTEVIPARIVLPNPNENYLFSHPHRYSHQDWFNTFFVEFEHKKKLVRSRVQCSSKNKNKSLFENMQSSKNRDHQRSLVDLYNISLLDFSLKPIVDRSFILTSHEE